MDVVHGRYSRLEGPLYMYLLYTCICGPHLKITSSSKEAISGPYSVLAFQPEGPEGRRKRSRGKSNWLHLILKGMEASLLMSCSLELSYVTFIKGSLRNKTNCKFYYQREEKRKLISEGQISVVPAILFGLINFQVSYT